MAEAPDMRAHRLASLVAARLFGHQRSIYNVVRGVLIEEFSTDEAPACTCIPYHLIGCPQYAYSWRRRRGEAVEGSPLDGLTAEEAAIDESFQDPLA